jgi:hypothetical protein
MTTIPPLLAPASNTLRFLGSFTLLYAIRRPLLKHIKKFRFYGYVGWWINGAFGMGFNT